MFAAQLSLDQRKRVREDESANGTMSFGEHRRKRIQCLPLHTAPQDLQQQWEPSMTPQNSDSDEHFRHGNASHWSTSEMLSQDQRYSDMDINLTKSNILGDQNAPGRLLAACPESGNPTSRMPTPIKPSFAAQVRGQQCEWAGPGPAVTALNGILGLGHCHNGYSGDQSVPRTVSSGWQAVQNNRRLPSPISEADDFMSTQFQGHPMENSECINLPVDSPPHEIEHPGVMMGIEPSSAPPFDPEGDQASPSPRRGHIRSRHTVNNWTWQPGMKRSFSIGYRADCEKCRLKVPGHFNHIIIS